MDSLEEGASNAAWEVSDAVLYVTQDDIADFLDYLCSVANLDEIYFPLADRNLPDPQDDMILELAVNAGCKYISRPL